MRLKGFVLIEKDSRYLLIQEASSKWKGQWFLPGGNPKDNETPDMGAIRETLEEAGCRVDLKGIFYIRYYNELFEKMMHLFYCGHVIGEDIKTHKDKHSLGARWFTYEEITMLPLRQDLLTIIDAYRANGNSIPTEYFKVIE